jgi:serine/threonine protein kinase
MPVESTANLIRVLRQTRLLAPGQLDELTQTLQHRFRDPRALARALMERDWLTPYQVNLLLQGCASDLVVGSYLILQRLHESFVGQVFKAQHQHMKRLVALTVVRASLLSQPEAVDRFYQEIQAASRLNHAHVLCAFDAGPVGSTHFFAIEYAEGIDLDLLVQQSGPLPPATASSLICQAALGLQHAYKRQLLHHDLRPSNLLLTHLGGKSETPSGKSDTPRPGPQAVADATLKICNLGLTLLQPRARGTVSSDSSFDEAIRAHGTVDYFAPEQAAGAPLTDVRSNLYSLGCIFYFLLTGQPPFPGGTSATKLQRHQQAEPQPLPALRRDVPPATAAVVRKLLAKRPEQRFQVPGELAVALGGAHESSSSGWSTPVNFRPGLPVARMAPAPMAPRGLPSLVKSRKRWYALAAGLVLLAAGAGLAFFLSRGAPDQPPEERTSDTPAAPVYQYRKMDTREATILETLRASGFPTLEGKWYYIGPFDNADKKGFATAYPPETEIDLAKTYPGKGGEVVGWKELADFKPGKIINLRRFKQNDWGCVYLYHEMESPAAEPMSVWFGSDDTLTVWLNGKKLMAEDVYRGAAPNQNLVPLPLRAGKNQLLIKVCQGTGDWAVYVSYPNWPPCLETLFSKRLRFHFPPH